MQTSQTQDYISIASTTLEHIGKPTLPAAIKGQLAALKQKYSDQPEVFQALKTATINLLDGIAAELQQRAGGKQ